MAKLEEQFESSKKLRQFSEELIAEKKAWKEFYTQALEDVEKCRVFLKEFRQVATQYKDVLSKFMAEVETIKEMKELVALNKQILELLKK